MEELPLLTDALSSVVVWTVPLGDNKAARFVLGENALLWWWPLDVFSVGEGGGMLFEVKFLKSRNEFSCKPLRFPDGDLLSTFIDPRVNLSNFVDNREAKLDFLLVVPFWFGVNNMPPSWNQNERKSVK